MALTDHLNSEHAAILVILAICLLVLFVVDPGWDLAVHLFQRWTIRRDVARQRRLLAHGARVDSEVRTDSVAVAVSGLSQGLNGVGFDRGRNKEKADARWRTPDGSNGQPYRGGDAA